MEYLIYSDKVKVKWINNTVCKGNNIGRAKYLNRGICKYAVVELIKIFI